MKTCFSDSIFSSKFWAVFEPKYRIFKDLKVIGKLYKQWSLLSNISFKTRDQCKKPKIYGFLGWFQEFSVSWWYPRVPACGYHTTTLINPGSGTGLGMCAKCSLVQKIWMKKKFGKIFLKIRAASKMWHFQNLGRNLGRKIFQKKNFFFSPCLKMK